MPTSIEWTDETWNPTRGCSRVSEGCRNCYAERIAARFNGTDIVDGQRKLRTFAGFAIRGQDGPHWTGRVELIESKLQEPLHWRKPRRVFVNSMSDLFHENLPYPDILHIFQTMGKCPRHTFQILTKRSAKMRELLSLFWWRNLGHSPAMGGDHWVKVIAGEQRAGDQNFLPNVWLGVSVENQQTADERIPLLLQTPAALRFVSYEPALGQVDFTALNGRIGGTRLDCLSGRWDDDDSCGESVDWIIVGGESGPGARPFHLEWAREAIRQCKAAGVPVFVKQLGSRLVGETADLIYLASMDSRKGGDWDQWPPDLRIRQFPDIDARRAARIPGPDASASGQKLASRFVK